MAKPNVWRLFSNNSPRVKSEGVIAIDNRAYENAPPVIMPEEYPIEKRKRGRPKRGA